MTTIEEDPFEFWEEEAEGWDESPLADLIFPPHPAVPAEELHRAVGETALLGRAVALARWVGEGRRLGGFFALDPSEASVAVTELGLAASGPVRIGSQHHPALEPSWVLAEELGLIRYPGVHSSVAGPGLRDWETGTDEDRLRIWTQATEVLFHRADQPGAGLRHGADAGFLDEFVVVALMDLYNLGTFEVPALLHEGATRCGVPDEELPETGDAIDRWLQLLADHGVVARDGDLVSVTPLGRWGLRAVALAYGVHEARWVDVVSMSAGELLREPLSHSDLPCTDLNLVHAWVNARTPNSALEELLSAADQLSTPRARLALCHPLAVMHARGCFAETRFTDHPLLGPYIRCEDERPTDHTFRLIDALSAIFDQLSPSLPRGSTPREIWPMAEELLAVPDVWTLDHPDLLPVLDGIGTHHPLNRGRKLGQKAAHKYRRARGA